MPLSFPTRRSILRTGLTLSASLAAPALLRADTQEHLMRVAGQCLMLGFTGKNADSAQAKALRTQLKKGYAGGVLFLRHNIGSASQVKALCESFLNVRSDLFLAIDQEGGAVQRLDEDQNVTDVDRPLRVVERYSPEQAQALYETLAKDLTTFGFNLNLAPVVDVHSASNPAIGKWGRAFSDNPDIIARYASSFVEAHHKHGLKTALKHFPGQGLARGDTHDGMVDITSSWSEDELKPFRLMIENGYRDMIMGGHVTHRQWDSKGRPLIFSPAVMKGLLRDRLKFKGVALTDDLDMGAIRKHYSLQDAVLKALQAGNDMIMLSNSLKPDSDLAEKTCAALIKTVQEDYMSADRLKEAAGRIKTLLPS
jgi:beta-N-acetylhexosaminidase